MKEDYPHSHSIFNKEDGNKSPKMEILKTSFLYLLLVSIFLSDGFANNALAINCTGFRTQTQGGWGAEPNGNNPGAYLHANFSTAIPQGVTIGSCGNTLTLTSAQAITNFLPSGSTPSALPIGTLTNPGGSYSNVLAGQAVTLTLNIGFDNANPLFSVNTNSLGSLVLTSGLFSGWTVNQVLAEANKVLGGCGSSYSPSDLNAALTSINENYDNGTVDKGFLTCSVTPPVTLFVIYSIPETCFGDSNGAISLSITGGVPPYTIQWSNGANTPLISNLPAGTYSVLVSDAVNSTASLSATIIEPPLLTIATTHTDILCNGASTGAINITPAGGTPPYSYLWSNGVNSEDLSNLIAGDYSVTVTCSNGCEATANMSITQPSPLVGSANGANVNCFGGSDGAVNLTASGGVPPYSYLWSNAATTEDINGIPAGPYTVIITDANACTASASDTITQPSLLVADVQGTNVSCFGGNDGAANLTVSGGVAPYSYSWSNGATAEDLSNLVASSYQVTVTDAHGCLTSTSLTITQPEALVIGSTKTNVLCYGGADGSINLTTSGGTPSYSYLWSNGATTEDLSGLIAGSYTVTITDAHACTVSGNISISQPSLIVLSETHLNVSAFGGSNGAINLTVSGGVPSYNYVWTNGSTNSSLSSLTAGTYNVTVSDANGCTKSLIVIVTQPPCSSVGLKNSNSRWMGCSS